MRSALILAATLAASGCFAPIDMQFDGAEASSANTMTIRVSSADDWLSASKDAAGAVYLITQICGLDRYGYVESIEAEARTQNDRHHYAIDMPRDLARLPDLTAPRDASVDRFGWPVAAVETNGVCMFVELPGYFGFRSRMVKTPQVKALLR